jgi:hypothetical protein
MITEALWGFGCSPLIVHIVNQKLLCVRSKPYNVICAPPSGHEPEGSETGALALSQASACVITLIMECSGISEAQIEGSKLPNCNHTDEAFQDAMSDQIRPDIASSRMKW